jgi:predicted peroxiredoxin
LADRATFYRHDLAYAADPTIPKNPHRFLLGQPTGTTASARLLVAAIARAYQDQIATFFASDGNKIIHPEPAGLFETPIAGALPEDLNFITGPLPKAPLLTINNVTVTASDTGIVTAMFTLSLSAASSQPVTVIYATADGTATAGGNDYVPISGTLTFAPGETTMTITVVVNPDKKKDVDETFFVDLSGAVNALLLDDQGLGIILSDDWK